LRKLSDCLLYGILDLGYVSEDDVEHVTRAMIEGEVDLIQVRAKNKSLSEIVELASELEEITSAYGIPLIVNDRAEVATQVPIQGVHVGQDDDSITVAREKAGREIFVGKSTHSLEQATTAQNEGADYIGWGPIFATPTKPDYKPIGLNEIKSVQSQVELPIFCIGGIKLENLAQVIAAGAKRVAIVSGLLKASDIVKYARACKKMLTSVL
jgi:thiamine-phosphate pyrophosphorylase